MTRSPTLRGSTAQPAWRSLVHRSSPTDAAPDAGAGHRPEREPIAHGHGSWWRVGTVWTALALALAACQPAEGQVETASTESSTAKPDGAQLYFSNCAGCHGREGQGAEGAYPALAGSRLVNGPYGPAMMPLMYGRGAMPGFAQLLSDEEMAAVLSYVRTSWGNGADEVSGGQVAPFRFDPAEVPLDPFQGDH